MAIQIPTNVVFDCDGTLVDSEEIHAKALQVALAELGVRLTVPEIRSQSAGIANRDYLARVAAERGVEFPPHADAWVEDISHRLIEHEIRLIEGADLTVRTLAARGVRLGVASNSSRRLVEQMLRTVGSGTVIRRPHRNPRRCRAREACPGCLSPCRAAARRAQRGLPRDRGLRRRCRCRPGGRHESNRPLPALDHLHLRAADRCRGKRSDKASGGDSGRRLRCELRELGIFLAPNMALQEVP